MPPYRLLPFFVFFLLSLVWFWPLAVASAFSTPLDAEIQVTPTTFEVIHESAAQTSTRVLTIQNLGDSFLHWASSESNNGCLSTTEIGWIAMPRDGGTINPQSQENVTYTIDSMTLRDGVHRADLCLTSNDPDEPLIRIAVQLTVGNPVALEFHHYLPVTRSR